MSTIVVVVASMSDAAVIQSELFPVLQEKLHKRSELWDYLKATSEHGALASVSMVAGALGVSRQRVHQFIDEGRLACVWVGDRKLVAAHDLERFLLIARRQGQSTEFHVAESYRAFLKRWRAEEAA